MLSWLRRIFGRGHVARPFEPLIAAMKAKDPQLWAEVGPMSFTSGRERWRQKYPDDLAGEYVKDARIN